MAGWQHKAGVAASAHGTSSTGFSFQLTAAGSFAVGEMIVVMLSAGATSGTQTISSLVDQLGNSYAALTPNAVKQYDAGNGGGSTSAIAAIYVSICSAPGTPTIVATFGRQPAWGWALGIDGFTGITSVTDATATPATGNGSTNPASNTSAATTNGSELAFAAYYDQGGGSTNSAVATYTAGVRISGSGDNNILLQYKDTGASGTTLSAGNPLPGTPGQPWAYLLVTLKIAASLGSETASVAESAAALVLGGTTPGVGEAVRGADAAFVTVAGDLPIPPGFGTARAPSWSQWLPQQTRYTFYFARLDTNAALGIFPLTEVRFTSLINKAGTFSASLPLSDRRLVPDPDLALAATEPEQTVVYIDRGGIIVGHASILARDYDIATDTLHLTGQDLWYWFGKRVISDALSYNEDIMQVQRDLVAYAQAKVNGGLSIQLDNTVFSGVNATKTYLAADFLNVATTCEDLANGSPGFEFRVRAAWQGSTIGRFLQQAYPRFGVPASTTAFLWSYPSGAILTLSWPEDGTATVRLLHGQGNQASDGTRPVTVNAGTPAYPLVEGVVSHSVDTLADLQPLVDAEAAAKATPVTIPRISVYGPVDPAYGVYHEGDHARYLVRPGVSSRFWTGLDEVWRVVGLEVTINEDGSESVTHLLSAAVV